MGCPNPHQCSRADYRLLREGGSDTGQYFCRSGRIVLTLSSENCSAVQVHGYESACVQEHARLISIGVCVRDK